MAAVGSSSCTGLGSHLKLNWDNSRYKIHSVFRFRLSSLLNALLYSEFPALCSKRIGPSANPIHVETRPDPFSDEGPTQDHVRRDKNEGTGGHINDGESSSSSSFAFALYISTTSSALYTKQSPNQISAKESYLTLFTSLFIDSSFGFLNRGCSYQLRDLNLRLRAWVRACVSVGGWVGALVACVSPSQVGLQQQANLLQRDTHQRLQASGSLVQQQSVIDQQKQSCPSQRPLSETSTMSIDSSAQTGHSAGGDWQEEAYQKMKSMREAYLPELNEMYQKIFMKLQQHESLPQQPNSEQLEKLKAFKGMLERVIAVLQINKADIVPSFKEKLVRYEKQIINFINASRPRKVAMQQGQLPPSHMQMPQQQQQQQSQPQITQVQSHENQMNLQLIDEFTRFCGINAAEFGAFDLR